MSESNESSSRAERFDKNARLPMFLSKDAQANYFTRGLNESNLMDSYTYKHRSLINELVSIQGTPRQKEKLIRALLDLVVKDEFNPCRINEIFSEIKDIESRTGINFMDSVLDHVDVFISHWKGSFKTNNVRREVMFQLIEEEKKSRDSIPVSDRLWGNCITHYFYGCANVPCISKDEDSDEEWSRNDNFDLNSQDPQSVFDELASDLAWLKTLPLNKRELNDSIRGIRLSFIRNEYPIILTRDDEITRRTAQEFCERAASAPKNERDQHIGSLITVYMCRYRERVAESREMYDQEDEELQENYLEEHAEKQEIFSEEKAFIESLNLPEWEAREWPEYLERIYNIRHFAPKKELQGDVHDRVRLLIKNFPEDGSFRVRFSEDPWMVISRLIKAYWSGNYFPDELRTMILSKECEYLFEGKFESIGENGMPITIFDLHSKFIAGSDKQRAILFDENSAALEQAYQSDMEIIRSLSLSEQELRNAERDYNIWLLEGKLPIPASSETPDDRAEIKKRFYHLNELGNFKGIFGATHVLQEFVDYWYGIVKREGK